MNGLRHFLLAVQFFTRIPVTGRLAAWVGYSPQMLRASAAHFPAIGWLMGGAAAAVLALMLTLLQRAGHSPLASSLVAGVLSLLATVWLTGAFHEDGLADVADGLGGSHDRERALDIMKDSRVGAFGALALVLAALLKLSLLGLLGAQGLATVTVAVLAAHVLSRFAPLWLIRWLPHVGDTARSKSKPLADQIGTAALVVACVWTLPALVLVAVGAGWPQLGAVALAWSLALAGMHRLFKRRLQGFTGDCLGATQQVTELALLLALALVPAGG